MDAILSMGGYGGYVWPAYGISAVVLAVVLVASIMAARRNEAELEQLQLTRRARRGAATSETTPIDTAMLESEQ